jgi:hypothetical protein
MKMIILAFMSIILSGCGTPVPHYNFAVDTPMQKAPADIKAKCDPVPKELQHGATMANQTTAYDNLVGLYGVCAQRDAAKADWLTSQGQ